MTLWEPYVVPCPGCGDTTARKRVMFTWWGGFVGPWLIGHVICRQCGTGFSERTGKSTATAVAVAITIAVVLAVAFVALIVVSSL